MTTYVDSSFIVPIYTRDIHTDQALRLLESRPVMSLTPLNRAELAHALYQQVFRGRVSSVEVDSAWDAFERDCASGVWIRVDLPLNTWETSVTLAREYGSTLGVRTLDSLHVACAMELKAERFWSFDERQKRLAEAVGLDTTG